MLTRAEWNVTASLFAVITLVFFAVLCVEFLRHAITFEDFKGAAVPVVTLIGGYFARMLGETTNG